MPERTRLTFLTGIETATVYSPYSPAECRDRLNARLDVERRRQNSGGYSVSGRAAASYLQMSIEADSEMTEGGGSRGYLTGFMTAYNGGTRIRCRLGAGDSLSMVIGFLVFGIWAFFFAAVGTDFAGFWNGNPFFILAIPLGLSLLVAGVGHLIGDSARRSSRTLLHLLNSTLGSGERHADRAAAIEDLWRNA